MRERNSRKAFSSQAKAGRMTTFLIHHFEEMWSEGLEKFGTNIEAEFSKILNFLENKKSEINEVIMTNFELGEDEPHQLAIKAFCEAENISFKTYEYGYGWSKDQYEYDPELVSEANRGVTWCDATREYYDEDDGYILLINE